MTFREFELDQKTRSAVERQMITMGEAANRISTVFRDAHPQVPWATLIQLRNFYAHGYDRLRPDQIWGTAKRLVPRVARLIAPLIEPEDGESY